MKAPFVAGRALEDAVGDGDARTLARLLKRHGSHEALVAIHGRFDGTLHYRALDCMLDFAKPGQEMLHDLVPKFAACARLLRNHGAPVLHQYSPNATGMRFVDTDWSHTGVTATVAELMREYIDAGLLDPNAVVPKHTVIGGLRPLACTFKVGNPAALQVLLDAGADIPAALAGTDHTDIIPYAASFDGPHSGEMTAVLAAHLMTRAVAQSPSTTPRAAPRRHCSV